ncbi:MAG: glucose-6-phosphate dehydrogenase assembly protein OpcA [Candidatus Eisenbacteria bacterium]|nr:glucose-6-phosphate dehydrogenase assembly protein OpcA [Candidatus Eisenbacteria bacterium]
MAKPVSGIPVFPTESRSVSVRALEEELASLWKSVAEARDPSGSTPVTRAALLTLIAVVPGDDAAQWMAAAVGRLTEGTPCRAIIVQLESAGGVPEPLAAFVSAHCHRVAGGRQVCCEQVTIRATPAGDAHLSNLVLPLLLPDLPVVLYWPEVALMMAPEARPVEPARGAQFLCDLDPFVDQVILDSALAAETGAFLSRALALAERPQGPGMRPIDLNWVRLLPWREALADAVDQCSIDPMTIIGATIETISQPGGSLPVRPRLLAGWLRERLARSTGGAFRATISPVAGEGPAGRIVGVQFDIAGGQSMAIQMESGALVVTHAGGDPIRIPRPIDPDDDLLCRVIERRETDAYFVRALRMAAADDSDGAIDPGP